MKKLFMLVALLIIIVFTLLFVMKFSKCDYENFTDNMITNSSFFKGKDLNNVEKKNTNNKIIIMDNPGESSHVIKQSAKLTTKEVSEVIYKIDIEVEKNKQYKLSCWIAHSDNWNGKNDIFYVKILRKETSPKIISSKGDVIDTKTIRDTIWELRSLTITIPNNSNNNIEWYLGYNPGNTEGFRYITDVSMKPYYYWLKDFSVTQGIKGFLTSFDNNSYTGNTIWKDLTGNGNDFKWSEKPQWHKTSGFNTFNKQLVGKKINHMGINPQDFSIVIFSQSKVNSSGTIFQIKDENNNIKLEVNIDTNKQSIIVKTGSKIKEINLGLVSTMDLIITLNIKSQTMSMYINEINAIKNENLTISSQSMGNSELMLNPTKKWKASLYNILLYNNELSQNEIKQINNYLIYNMSINSGLIKHKKITDCELKKPDMTRLQFNYENPNTEEEETSIETLERDLVEQTDEDIINEENNYWTRLGIGVPKGIASKNMGKGYNIERCKESCLDSQEPFKCKVFSISDDGEGVCNLYTQSNILDRENKNKQFISYEYNKKDNIEGFIPKIHISKNRPIENFSTQIFKKSSMDSTKYIDKLKIKITKSLNYLEILENKQKILFKEKIKNLLISLNNYKNDKRKKKELLKYLENIKQLNNNYNKNILSKRNDLISRLLKLENIDQKPDIFKNKNIEIERNTLIDTQGSYINNATYKKECPKVKCKNDSNCKLWVYDKNGCQTCKCYEYYENDFDKNIFNRIKYQPKEKSDWQEQPNMNEYIRKDQIPCWGCNLDPPDCYQKCKKKENMVDDYDHNSIYKYDYGEN